VGGIMIFGALLIVSFGLGMAFAGDPGDCGDGRQISVDPGLAAEYDARWALFVDRVRAGSPATIVVTESEATSRVRQFLAAQDAPIREARICFVAGGSDATGMISTPFGRDVKVRASATVDLSGPRPVVDVYDIRIGGLPGAVARPFEARVTRVVREQAERIPLGHSMSAEIRDGEVAITADVTLARPE
jgi:hypothetical protein